MTDKQEKFLLEIWRKLHKNNDNLLVCALPMLDSELEHVTISELVEFTYNILDKWNTASNGIDELIKTIPEHFLNDPKPN